MNKFTNYVRTEWIYWVAALILLIAIGYVPAGEASTTSQKAGEFIITYDDEPSMWSISHHGQVLPIGDTYDAIRVHWFGKYKGNSVVLVSGQQGSMCEMAFRVYFTDNLGIIHDTREFGTCYSSSVSVSFYKNNIVVTLDGKVYSIPLK